MVNLSLIYPLTPVVEKAINDGTCYLQLYKLKNDRGTYPYKVINNDHVYFPKKKGWRKVAPNTLGFSSTSFLKSINKNLPDTNIVENDPNGIIQVQIPLSNANIQIIDGVKCVVCEIDLVDMACKMCYFYTYDDPTMVYIYKPTIFNNHSIESSAPVSARTKYGIIGKENRGLYRSLKYMYSLVADDNEVGYSDCFKIIYGGSTQEAPSISLGYTIEQWYFILPTP